MNDLLIYFNKKENRKVLIIALILLIAIPITFYLVKQTQILRSRADTGIPTLVFTGSNPQSGFVSATNNANAKTTSDRVNLRLSFAGEPSPTPGGATITPGGATATPGPSSTPGPSPIPSRTPTPSPTGSALSCQACTVGEICAKISQGTLPNVIKECKYIPDSQGGMNVDVLLSSAQVTNNQTTLFIQFYLGTVAQLGTPITKTLNIAGTSVTATPGPGTPTVAPATTTPQPTNSASCTINPQWTGVPCGSIRCQLTGPAGCTPIDVSSDRCSVSSLPAGCQPPTAAPTAAPGAITYKISEDPTFTTRVSEGAYDPNAFIDFALSGTGDKTIWVQFYRDGQPQGSPISRVVNYSPSATATPTAVPTGSRTVTATPIGQQTCTRSNPTVSIDLVGGQGIPGQTLTYDVTVTNNDSSICDSSIFSIVPTLPGSAWSQDPPSRTTTLVPGQVFTYAVYIQSQNESYGPYYFTQTATNTAAPSYTGSARAIYNVIIPTPTTVPTSPPAVFTPIAYRVFKDALGGPQNVPESAILASGNYGGVDIITRDIDISSLGSPGDIVTVYAQFQVRSNGGVETWLYPMSADIRIPYPPATGCTISGVGTIGMNDEGKVYLAEPRSNTDCNGLSSGPGSCSWTLLETNPPYQEFKFGNNNPQDLRPFGMGVVNTGSYRLTYVQTGGGDNNAANRDCSKDITISP